MTKIKSLFDHSKNIYRTIEKVITYNAMQEHRLKAEVSEYVVTNSIEEQLEKLLTKMQYAMDIGQDGEIGVWVSGFYGSGKSSFTKYLGMALDEQVKIDGIPFIQYLQDRLHTPQTKAQLSVIAKRFPAAIVFLDLASDMVAGATMEEVSTVLYYKVLQWAGYSRNLKIAALERKIQKDGRYEEFKSKVLDQVGEKWHAVQNDPLVVDSIIPDIAHEMYPELFKSPSSFTTETKEFVKFETERVQEMLEIVKEKTGKEYVVFIVDEVGQYVGSRPNLILNLDGLAKNLKNIGQGKAWIIGTAQQTLTEDDPRTALNSPELYKLKDRFPIQVDLESSDIKEICYRRLLGKSPQGETVLEDLFNKHGQSLRHHTKLQDAKYYDAEFNKDTFINLYPFLPAHFDILLHLLGALAKSTGGIGLRSAIKVIQDILIEGSDGKSPVAENSIGWLATTVTLYDILEKDIKRAFPSIHDAVKKVLIRFSDSEIHKDVAKTVAVLQILGNIPVTIHNVTSLMHPSIDAQSRLKEIENAISQLVNDPMVPFGEQDGNLCFFSEKLNDIEQERSQLPLRSVDTRRILNEALRDTYSPLPSIRLNGTLVVTSGLKFQSNSFSASLAGERETIQTAVELVEPNDYDTARTRLIEESRHKTSQYQIYLLGRNASDIQEKVAEIFRCRQIANRYRNEPDQEIKDYCVSQNDRANSIALDLQHCLKNILLKGSFIFRGQTSAVGSHDQSLIEAAKKYLAGVAEQVFDRFSEAPIRAETSLAEQFLRLGNLTGVTIKTDPLELVVMQVGRPSIKTDLKALCSIRDFLDRNGTVEGKRLMEHFTGPPFGWSPDTLRYLCAALLIAGEIKLKISGREITVNGQQAIDALKTNNSFKNVGVSLRDERPSMDVLARASDRLTDLIGDLVVPLEDEISKMATKHLSKFQTKYSPLEGKLSFLSLPGVDIIQALNQEIADIMYTDASDVPQRLGSEESSLYDNLKWAGKVDSALKSGLEETIRALQEHRREILALPEAGIPGRLREELSEDLDVMNQRLAKNDFFEHHPDLNTLLTSIKSQTHDAAKEMYETQSKDIKDAELNVNKLPGWDELTQEEKANVLAQIEELSIEVSYDLKGLKKLINQYMVIQNKLQDLKNSIERQGQQRQLKRIEEEKEKAKQEGKSRVEKLIRIPNVLNSVEQIDILINQLLELKNELKLNKDILIKTNIED